MPSEFKRGNVVKAWGHLVGIVQNKTTDGYRITIDPIEPTGLYNSSGPRWWISVPTEALELLGE